MRRGTNIAKLLVKEGVTETSKAITSFLERQAPYGFEVVRDMGVHVPGRWHTSALFDAWMPDRIVVFYKPYHAGAWSRATVLEWDLPNMQYQATDRIEVNLLAEYPHYITVVGIHLGALRICEVRRTCHSENTP